MKQITNPDNNMWRICDPPQRAERVAARIGGGGLKVIDQEHGLSDKSGSVFQQSLRQINDRILEKNDIECIANGLSSNDKLKIDMNEVPERLQAKLITDYDKFRHMIADAQSIHHNEPDVYFYHSDHLGSASWITDNGGIAVQHLQYLPYGERYVDQRASGYHERFTFTGKERDEETGYGYFGARYMDHELMTMWLSVDPMADKYPNISPYAYCAWNPVKLIDPDGRDWYKTKDGKMNYTVEYTSIEKFQKSGIKGEYLGKTATVGSKYYSLFGQVLNKNSKNGQITMKIDDAMMKYKEFGIAYANYSKSSSYRDPEPSHSYTDLRIPSVPFSKSSENIHGPIEMGTYAGMADIYYYVNGNEKFMQARLESWSPTTCVSGRNGIGSSPSKRGKDGKFINSYITIRNENSYNGVILGLNFHNEQQLANFKKKLDALYK